MNVEYKARITGDISGLEKVLKKANGSMQQITDKDFVIKLDYDGNVKALNKTLSDAIKACPELAIQFQYDVNKKALDQKLNEIQNIESFKVDIDTKKVKQRIREMVSDIQTGFDSHLDTEDVTKKKIEDLYRYMNTAAKAGVDVSGSLSGLDQIDKDLDGFLTKLSKTPQYLFDMSEGIDGALKKTRDEVEEIKKQLAFFESKGAASNAIVSDAKKANKEINELSEEFEELAENIEDAFNDAKLGKNTVTQAKQITSATKEYWEGVKQAIDDGDESAKEFYQTLGLLNKEGTLDLITSGNKNIGGVIGEDRVAIARKNKEGVGGYEDTLALKKKLDEAYSSGIQVARILDVIGDKQSDTFLEVQEKAQGQSLATYWSHTLSGMDEVNTAFFEATEEQIRKLVRDLLELQKLGINAELNPENILYDKTKGFTIIDLDSRVTSYTNAANLVEDASERIVGEVAQMYDAMEGKDREQGLAMTSDFKKKFDRIAKEMADVVDTAEKATEEAQDSHSPSRVAEKLGEKWSVGYAEGIKKHKSDVEDAVRELVKAGELTMQDLVDDLPNIVGNADYADLENPVKKILADSEMHVGNESEDAAGKIGKAEDAISSEGAAAKETAQEKEKLAAAEREAANASDELSDSVKDIPALLEDSSGQTGNIEKMTAAEKDLANAIEEVGDNAKESSESLGKDFAAVKDASYIQGVIDSQNRYRASVEATSRALQDEINSQKIVAANEQRDNTATRNTNIASVRDLAMQEEIASSQKKYKQSIEATTTALLDQINTERSLEQYARRVPMTSEEAFRQYGEELDQANVKTKELEKSLKQAIAVTKAADSAGSSVETLSDLYKEANRSGTKHNTDAAASYKNLTKNAKMYYDLLLKESSGTITGTEIQRLEELKKEWADATAAVGKYKTVAGSDDSIAKLNKARDSFNNSDMVSAIKTSQELSESENKLRELVRSGKYTSELSERMKEIADKISIINATPIDLKSDEAVRNLGEISVAIDKAFDDAKIADFRKAHESSIAKLNLQIEEFMNKNSKMGSKFKEQFQNLKLDWDTEHTNEELEELVAKFARLKGEVAAAGKLGASFLNTVRERLMGVNAQLIAQYLSLQDIIRYVQAIARNVIAVDTALTELRKVSDASTGRLQQSFEASAKSAQELGRSITDVINSTSDWSRAGFDIDAAEELARVSTLYQNVGDNIDAATANEHLVSALRGFHKGAEDAERIVDVYNEVANKFSIDTAGIGEALQRSASVFYNASTDLESAVALVTGANEIVQDPSRVGNAWKTISARIRASKNELVEMGEETEDMFESTAKLQDYLIDMTGVDIIDAEGNFRNLKDIVVDLGKAFEKIDNEFVKQEVAEKLAGKTQMNVLLSAISNYKQIENAYDAATHAAGSAAREQENYSKSVQYSMDRMQASIEELSYDMLNSDFLKSAIEFANDFIQAIDTIVEHSNALLDIFALLGAGFGIKYRKEIKEFSQDAVKSIKAIGAEAMRTGKASMDMTAFGAGLKTIAPTLGVGAAAAAVAAIIVETKRANDELRKSAQDLAQTFSSAEANIDSYKNTIEGLYSTINNENSSYEESKAARERLLSIQDELIEKYGKEAESINLITDAVNGEIDALDKLTDIQWQKTINQFNEQNLPGIDFLNRWSHQANNNVEVMLSDMEDTMRSVFLGKDDFDFAQQMADMFGGTAVLGDNNAVLTFSGNLDDIYDKLFAIQGIARESDVVSDLGINNINTAVSKIEDLIDLYGDFYNQYVMNERVFGTEYESVYSDIVDEYKNYKAALVNEDEDAAKKSKEAIMAQYAALKESMTDANGNISTEDLSVYNALSALIPELQNELNANVLKIHLELDSEEIDSEKEEIAQLIRSFGNEESLTGYIEGSDAILDEKYAQLKAYAKSNKIAIEDLIALYRELSMLEDFESRDTGTLAARYRDSASGVQSLESYKATKEAFSALSDESYEIVKNFGDPQWKDVSDELFRIAGTTDVAVAGAKAYQEALEVVAQKWTEVKEASESAEEAWSTTRDTALEKLGLAKEGRDGLEYDDSWTNYLETIKQLNPELADNQEELEKCALANMQFSHAVDDLSKNFKTYKESLKDASGLTPEFSDAINALADDLTYLTGINFSITEAADFLGEAENLELLEKAINGSDEALQKLQARAAETIKVKVDPTAVEELRTIVENALSELPDDHEIDLNLNSEVFNEEIQNFANWLNENSDMGQVDVYAMLDSSPFMRNLGELMSESSSVATAVKKMFSDLGWDVDWDTVKVATPNGSHITSTFAKDAYGNPIGPSYVKWDYVEVPTNIRYIPKSSGSGKLPTAPYTPKSLSPAQKSNAATNIDKANGGSNKDKEDDYKEFIDYFERLVKTLDNSIDLLEAHLQDVVGSFAKNTLLDAQEDLIKKKMDGYASAIGMYSQKASEALSKIPSDVAAKIQNGAVAIDEFVGESNKDVVDAIGDYEQWADKVADCKQQIVELREELRQLELQKFKNVAQDFTELFDRRQSAIDSISKAISLFEAASDKIVGRGFYDVSIDQTEKQLNHLNEERDALVAQMNSAIAAGINMNVPCYSNVA